MPTNIQLVNLVTYAEPQMVSITSTSTSIVGRNDKRKYLCIVNAGGSTVYLAVGHEAVVKHGITLYAPGGSFEMILDNLSVQEVNGVCEDGETTIVSVQEAV